MRTTPSRLGSAQWAGCPTLSAGPPSCPSRSPPFRSSPPTQSARAPPLVQPVTGAHRRLGRRRSWRKRFAAMMAVSELGAGSAKLMRKEMPRIVDMVLRLLGVRRAACPRPASARPSTGSCTLPSPLSPGRTHTRVCGSPPCTAWAGSPRTSRASSSRSTMRKWFPPSCRCWAMGPSANACADTPSAPSAASPTRTTAPRALSRPTSSPSWRRSLPHCSRGAARTAPARAARSPR